MDTSSNLLGAGDAPPPSSAKLLLFLLTAVPTPSSLTLPPSGPGPADAPCPPHRVTRPPGLPGLSPSFVTWEMTGEVNAEIPSRPNAPCQGEAEQWDAHASWPHSESGGRSPHAHWGQLEGAEAHPEIPRDLLQSLEPDFLLRILSILQTTELLLESPPPRAGFVKGRRHSCSGKRSVRR